MTKDERKLFFGMYLSGLRGMSLHPGAGQRDHRARRRDEDVREACDMLIDMERLERSGFFDDPTLHVPPE